MAVSVDVSFLPLIEISFSAEIVVTTKFLFAFYISFLYKLLRCQWNLACSEKKTDNDDESQGQISKSNTEASICSSKDHRIKALVKQIKFVPNKKP